MRKHRFCRMSAPFHTRGKLIYWTNPHFSYRFWYAIAKARIQISPLIGRGFQGFQGTDSPCFAPRTLNQFRYSGLLRKDSRANSTPKNLNLAG
jgi:hypothetical protein